MRVEKSNVKSHSWRLWFEFDILILKNRLCRECYSGSFHSLFAGVLHTHTRHKSRVCIDWTRIHSLVWLLLISILYFVSQCRLHCAQNRNVVAISYARFQCVFSFLMFSFIIILLRSIRLVFRIDVLFVFCYQRIRASTLVPNKIRTNTTTTATKTTSWYIQCRERESYRMNQTKSCEWRKSTQFSIDKRVFLQIVCVYSCWNSYLHILAIQVRFITPSIDLILFSFYFLLLFIINFFFFGLGCSLPSLYRSSTFLSFSRNFPYIFHHIRFHGTFSSIDYRDHCGNKQVYVCAIRMCDDVSIDMWKI